MNIKVGDRLRYIYKSKRFAELEGKDCTVISVTNTFDVTWDDESLNSLVTMKDWSLKMASGYWIHLSASGPDLKIVSQTKEAPCKQCQRKNDVGIAKCWCCEVANPC